MAKEVKIVAVKATAEIFNLLNGAQLQLGDVIYVPKGAPFGDTPKAAAAREAALAARKTGKRVFIPAPPFLAAALLRPCRKAEPFWLHTSIIRGTGPVYQEDQATVLRSERTKALYLGLNQLTPVRQLIHHVAYEGQELALKVVDFSDGFKEPSVSKLWAQGPDGAWTFRPAEGDVIHLRPCKAALFELTELTLTPAERAAATKAALSCFK